MWIITHGNDVKNISISEPILHLTSHLQSRLNGKNTRTVVGKAKSCEVGKSSLTTHPRFNHNLNVIWYHLTSLPGAEKRDSPWLLRRAWLPVKNHGGRGKAVCHYSFFLGSVVSIFACESPSCNTSIINIVAVNICFFISLLYLINCFYLNPWSSSFVPAILNSIPLQ